MNDNKIDVLRQSIKKIKNQKDTIDNCDGVIAETQRCFKRIIVLINYKERCSEELRIRLVKNEKFSEKAFYSALKKAIKLNIVDDNRYAEIYTFCMLQSNKGVYGIKKHLSCMKINYKLNQNVNNMLDEAKQKERITAINYIKSHPTRSKNQYQSIVLKLIRNGYSANLANEVAEYLK